jgi:hypothetical protein
MEAVLHDGDELLVAELFVAIDIKELEDDVDEVLVQGVSSHRLH